MKLLPKRGVVLAISIPALYLGLVNGALNLPLTQELVNGIRPEKFHVTWERAWTLLPFRVHVRGLAANGQTRKQQWQVSAAAASASINPLVLFRRKVKVYGVEARDVVYHQRPRPRPDRDYAEVRQYFPPIEGRELETTPPDLPPPKQGRGWTIQVEDARATGTNRLWIYQLQATLAGEVRADVEGRTRGGPVAVANGAADVVVESLLLNSEEMGWGGKVSGSFELLPFIPGEHPGIAKLAFLEADAEIDAESESLAFLNPYLEPFEGMRVDGRGRAKGRVRFSKGRLEPGSALVVEAPVMGLDLLGYRVEGVGRIHVAAPGDGGETTVRIEFGELEARDAQDATLFFRGEGLTVTARGNVSIPGLADEGVEASYLAFSIPSMKVPDLGVYQRFLPEGWAFTLHGGEAELRATAELTPTSFQSSVQLASAEAEAGFGEYRFRSDLGLVFNIDSPSLETGRFNLAGSRLELENTRFSTADDSAPRWDAAVVVEKGVAKLELEGVEAGRLPGLEEIDFRTLVASAAEELEISGRISDLQWLDLLLENSYGLEIRGQGEIAANLAVVAGALQEGSRVTITPRNLAVDFLDYRATGDGSIVLDVTRSGEHPDMVLDLRLEDARFGRKEEQQGFVEEAEIGLRVEAKAVNFSREERERKAGREEILLHLRIPGATLTDMSAYNRYLPDESPFRILGGTASLVADVRMEPGDAKGSVQLVTEKFSARIDDQQVAGRLTADIVLAGGVPEAMRFDISGSSLLLDDVRVTGAKKNFSGQGWSARFLLTKGHAVWKKPVQLDLEARVEMTDSRPIVALIANQRGRHGWIGKALTVRNLQGGARVKMTQEKIVIPYALAGSDRIDVGAKGTISEEGRDGVFYLRYRKLSALLRIRDGKRRLEMVNARKKFDDYWDSPMATAGGSGTGRADGGKKKARRWWQRKG